MSIQEAFGDRFVYLVVMVLVATVAINAIDIVVIARDIVFELDM